MSNDLPEELPRAAGTSPRALGAVFVGSEWDRPWDHNQLSGFVARRE